MSFPTTIVHDTLPQNRGRSRFSLLTCPRRFDAAPIPPTLANSPHLSSPNSIFRRKPPMLRWPSQEEDEWLRDMVPLDRASTFDGDARSEGLNDSNPSPTSSDGSYGSLLFPPSPMLRPRSTSPDVPTQANRALCGSGFGPSPHTITLRGR